MTSILVPSPTDSINYWCLRQVHLFSASAPAALRIPLLKDIIKKVIAFFGMNEFQTLMLLEQLKVEGRPQLSSSCTVVLPREVKDWLGSHHFELVYLDIILVARAVKQYMNMAIAIYDEKLKGCMGEPSDWQAVVEEWTKINTGASFAKLFMPTLNRNWNAVRSVANQPTIDRLDDMNLKALWILKSHSNDGNLSDLAVINPLMKDSLKQHPDMVEKFRSELIAGQGRRKKPKPAPPAPVLPVLPPVIHRESRSTSSKLKEEPMPSDPIDQIQALEAKGMNFYRSKQSMHQAISSNGLAQGADADDIFQEQKPKEPIINLDISRPSDLSKFKFDEKLEKPEKPKSFRPFGGFSRTQQPAADKEQDE